MHPKDRDLRQQFLRSVLRPLVRFCLRGSLSIQGFIDELKVVYVEVGEEELRKTTAKVNVSRLSVMTGVHRKDVTRIYRQDDPPKHRAAPILTRLIGQWEQDPKFKTKKGKPRILSLDGENSEFAQLAASVSKNINPSTLAFELERIGAAKLSSRGIKLTQDIHRVGLEPEKRFEHLSRNVELLIHAGEENLYNPKPTRNLNLRTEYDNIFRKDVPRIRKWLLKEGMAFHRRVRAYLARYDSDVHPSESEQAGASVVLGSFSLSLNDEE